MLTLEIVSDIVCPWCYIGLRRLDAAIDLVRREHPGFSCRKLWRPFFLNPQTPPEGEPYLPFLIAKFGSREAVEALFERVRMAGAAHGLHYAFERIERRANTLQAHRLIHWAQQQGDAQALVERLFEAQFVRGEHVGSMEVLVAAAADCGHAAEAVRAYLAGDEDVGLVRDMEAAFRRMGVRQVPTFIVGGREVVVGAEDPATLAAAILRAGA